MGLVSKGKCPEEVSSDPPVVWLFPAASSPCKKREKGGMCPRLVNSPLALHTDEQHRIVHAHLVNILKSSLMKNQSSIINHSRSDLIRDNLGVPFCLNPFVVVWVVLSFWPLWFYSFLIRADVCPSVTLSSFLILGLECPWL